MKAACRAGSHSQPKPFSEQEILPNDGKNDGRAEPTLAVAVERRDKFRRIMVKTTVACSLKRLNVNFKHMSQRA